MNESSLNALKSARSRCELDIAVAQARKAELEEELAQVDTQISVLNARCDALTEDIEAATP